MCCRASREFSVDARLGCHAATGGTAATSSKSRSASRIQNPGPQGPSGSAARICSRLPPQVHSDPSVESQPGFKARSGSWIWYAVGPKEFRISPVAGMLRNHGSLQWTPGGVVFVFIKLSFEITCVRTIGEWMNLAEGSRGRAPPPIHPWPGLARCHGAPAQLGSKSAALRRELGSEGEKPPLCEAGREGGAHARWMRRCSRFPTSEAAFTLEKTLLLSF